MKVFVAFSAPHFSRDLADLTQRNVAEDLRKLHQRCESGDETWRAWAINSLGTVVYIAGGKGLVEVPADRLGELDGIRESYSQCLSSPVAVGVGTSPADADTALRVAEHQGGDRIVLYRQGIEGSLSEKKDSQQSFDAVFDRIIADDQDGAEGAAMEKADGGQVGFHRPQAVAQPAAPAAGTADHSEGQAAMAAINDPERPPPPEATHAAADFEDELHQLAGAQQQQDGQQAQARGQETDAIRSRLAAILEKVRAQAPGLGAMQKQAPEMYDAIMGLVQGVIAMGRVIAPGPKAVAKAEGLEKGDVIDFKSRAADLQEKQAASQQAEHDKGFSEFMARMNAPRDTLADVQRIITGPPGYDAKSSPPRAEQAEGHHAYYHPASGSYVTSGTGEMEPAKLSEWSAYHVGKGHEAEKSSWWIHFPPGGDHRFITAHPEGIVEHPVFSKDEMTPGGHKPKFPVGTKFDGGPTADARPGRVGRIKTKHGDGTISDKSMRAGMVTAVADRHAPPVMGSASHPTSSRTPTAR